MSGTTRTAALLTAVLAVAALAACGDDPGAGGAAAAAGGSADRPTDAGPATTGEPDPTGPVAPDDPVVVMVLGDSVTYEIAPALEAALESGGAAVVEDRTQVGLGLSRWPIFPWLEVWYPFVDELRPDAVVVQTGIWDVLPAVIGGDERDPRPSDPDWEERYDYLMDRLVSLVTVHGARVYWATMLPYGEDLAESDRLNDRVQSLAERDDRVEVVDLDPAFLRADGTYTATATVDGTLVPLRKADGIHLCRAGAAAAAELIAAAIVADWDLPLADGWEDGDWRDDARYDVDPCPASGKP